MKLKVCGLTQIAQIEELISMKIDFLGFIFYEKSPRFVGNHLSLEEISALKHQGKVGVFVNESIENIVEISQKADLNFVQLHGDETATFISELRKKLPQKTEIINVFRIGNQSEEALQNTINAYCLLPITYCLFDKDGKGFGGTGEAFDWSILNELKIPKPYFLGGGISDEHYDTIKTLHPFPYALDINSQFEVRAGLKDVKKIQHFFENLKNITR